MFEALAFRIGEIANRHCDGRVVATGGGGYAIHQVVPRAWTLTWAALCGDHAPDAIPPGWLESAGRGAGVDIPATLRDPAGFVPPTPRHDEVVRANELTVQALRRRLLPLMTGWGLGF
jgi:acetoin utilization protein AcuC